MSVPTASATPEFAPICETGTAEVLLPPQCRTPIAEESSVFCTKKDPYNLILINQGASYEVLTRGFRCTDAGKKDDRQMLTCNGQMAAPFEIRVCDPACAVPTVLAAVTQCPQGYFYNNIRGCCTQESQQIQPNCVVLKLKTKTCEVNCNEFKKKTTCNQNTYACTWDADNNICLLRR